MTVTSSPGPFPRYTLTGFKHQSSDGDYMRFSDHKKELEATVGEWRRTTSNLHKRIAELERELVEAHRIISGHVRQP